MSVIVISAVLANELTTDNSAVGFTRSEAACSSPSQVEEEGCVIGWEGAGLILQLTDETASPYMTVRSWTRGYLRTESANGKEL